MDDILNTQPEASITTDATRAAAVGAASIIGSFLGIAVVIGATAGIGKVIEMRNQKKTKKNDDN